ncbi:5-methyltetrahydrofolate--homocysteine methyltransferase [Pacificimonas flava]|uniref:Methionine synthase n=2 Tax=Pacificimonas TaxID=1960290 RepID=A0A219B2P8_9SPHN|nr:MULTISPECIES: homocysteine S-methyltransferase family protein [Pacificimonas]MBZ6377926.1 homocysteine S-methyltransferase family protein [Pacificimonas aurantium]OWV32416.1 5-methyltetrahydrofolate--homocysteine methyltransferase [Pacificimonas flava]
MSVRDRFLTAAKRRILIKDGPYGTQVQARKLQEADYRGDLDLSADQKGNNDLLNVTRPKLIEEVAHDYISAGAHILATNTFNANRISQADYAAEHLVGEINRSAASILRKAVDARDDGIDRFVCGAVGPTNKTLSISPDVNDPGHRDVGFDEMKAVYREQIDALIDGGCDVVLIETVFDTLNAKAAAMATMEAGEELGRDIPMMVSLTLTDMAGRNLSGQGIEAFWYSMRHARPLTIGLNCSFGATELRPHVAALSKIADAAVMVYPNAGLPNELGEYDEAAETTAALVKEWAGKGYVNAVGGCCGTTPTHIRAIADALEGCSPRRIPQIPPALRLAGLDAFSVAA